jgi:hypothetical protein
MCDFGEWLPTDAVTAAGPALARHDTYPVAWQSVHRQTLDAVGDGKERLFFARSGWLGTPALADVIWAGDQRTDFERDDGLPTILPIGIGLGIVGISTYGHDIAGYQSATNPPSTQELFFRWTELGAWSPVMRTHHGTTPKLEWSWDEDDATIAHFARYARLHMALFPFFEGLAASAAATGMPIWRGLMLAYPEDATVWPITDEVMVGDGVLVAPVETAGATSRTTYLLAGRWYPFAGGTAVDGAQTIESDAAVTEIPVYVRAGTVVPMLPDGVMTAVSGTPDVPDVASVGDDRVLDAFLGGDGSFAEATGLSYAVARLAGDPGGDAAVRVAGGGARGVRSEHAGAAVPRRDRSGRTDRARGRTGGARRDGERDGRRARLGHGRRGDPTARPRRAALKRRRARRSDDRGLGRARVHFGGFLGRHVLAVRGELRVQATPADA